MKPRAKPTKLVEQEVLLATQRGGGFRYVAVQSDDRTADVVAMRRRGVEVGKATKGARRTPAGHLTPLDERRRSHGVPPPACGVRNTAEQAMLVLPEHACGAYIGLVGP